MSDPEESDRPDGGGVLNMTASTSIRHVDTCSGDVTHVYVEQSDAGRDVAQVTISNGTTIFHLMCMDAEGLDGLSEFLAEAAQMLRYCTRESD